MLSNLAKITELVNGRASVSDFKALDYDVTAPPNIDFVLCDVRKNSAPPMVNGSLEGLRVPTESCYLRG